KVDEYYQKMSNSNSYMFAMVLDPRKKLSYFQKHWPKSLQDQAKSNIEKTVPVLFALALIFGLTEITVQSPLPPIACRQVRHFDVRILTDVEVHQAHQISTCRHSAR
ncbi:hypothetical protein DFH06DRAFT_987171, partial [Mycena polygramma]